MAEGSSHHKQSPGERRASLITYEELIGTQITQKTLDSLTAWKDREMQILRNKSDSEDTQNLASSTVFGIIDFFRKLEETKKHIGHVILAKNNDGQVIGASLMTLNPEKNDVLSVFVGVETSAQRQNIGTNLLARGLTSLKQNHGINQYHTEGWDPSIALLRKVEKPWGLKLKIQHGPVRGRQSITVDFSKAKIPIT